MSLLNRPRVEGWVDSAFKWLEDIEDNPSLISVYSNPWKIMEKRFKEAFSNYTEQECTQDQLKKLKMSNDNLDEYIAAFKTLGA